MAPAQINFSTVLDEPNFSASPSQPGCYVISDFTILLGAYTNDTPGKFAFYRSTNDGQSWFPVSELPPGDHTFAARLVTLPPNIIIFPVAYEDTNTGKIYRSTDGGDTWTIAASVPFSAGAGQPHGCYGCTGIQRRGAIVGGNFGGTPASGTLLQFTRSLDAGITWSNNPPLYVDTDGSWVNAIATGANGKLAAGVASVFGVTPPIKISLSTDYGTTWPSTVPLPATGSPNAFDIFSITWVTSDIVLASGQVSGTGGASTTPLWRSTNAGTSWTQIPSGNISDWHAPAAQRGIYEVRRLTRDLCAFGWGRTFNDGTPPWRFSADAGATWLVPTTSDASWGSLDGKTSGAICTTPGGKILVATIVNNNLRVFRGTYEC